MTADDSELVRRVAHLLPSRLANEVRAWIEQGEWEKRTLRNVAVTADERADDALRQLQAARACIVAADAMRPFVSSGTLTTSNDNKVVTMTNPAADAYDAARAALGAGEGTK